MDSAEQAVLCVLMLRGAQTPGELKQRTERMHAFADLAGVHATLQSLIERDLVARLDRRPGHKEERYAELLQAERAGAARLAARPRRACTAAEPAGPDGLLERVERLEAEVAELRARDARSFFATADDPRRPPSSSPARPTPPPASASRSRWRPGSCRSCLPACFRSFRDTSRRSSV